MHGLVLISGGQVVTAESATHMGASENQEGLFQQG